MRRDDPTDEDVFVAIKTFANRMLNEGFDFVTLITDANQISQRGSQLVGELRTLQAPTPSP